MCVWGHEAGFEPERLVLFRMSVQVHDRKYMECAKGRDETKRNKTKRNESNCLSHEERVGWGWGGIGNRQ